MAGVTFCSRLHAATALCHSPPPLPRHSCCTHTAHPPLPRSAAMAHLLDDDDDIDHTQQCTQLQCTQLQCTRREEERRQFDALQHNWIVAQNHRRMLHLKLIYIEKHAARTAATLAEQRITQEVTIAATHTALSLIHSTLWLICVRWLCVLTVACRCRAPPPPHPLPQWRIRWMVRRCSSCRSRTITSMSWAAPRGAGWFAGRRTSWHPSAP